MVPDYLDKANLATKDGRIYSWLIFYFLLRCSTVISDGLWRYPAADSFGRVSAADSVA